ncbi:hypothetical protein E9993_23105, partial [Labilibacter sediminis]
MSEELKASFERHGAYSINQKLKEKFHDPASQGRSFGMESPIMCEEKMMTSVCTHSHLEECYMDSIEESELADFVVALIELETRFKNVVPMLFNKNQEDSPSAKDEKVSSTKRSA